MFTTEKKDQPVEVITTKLLKSWSPCTDGYKRFCELFPDGADLKTAIDGLVADGHDDWGNWLFNRCKEKALFSEYIANGYRNAGHWNAGNRNAGNMNAGDMNAGHWNAGNRNAGNMNAGNRNAGNMNAGDMNAGNRNAGHWNAGHWNAGNRNAGHWNAGNRNAGHWNAGNRNAGHFNTITPDTIQVFNKACRMSDWENATIPSFLYFELTEWVSDTAMTDKEKTDNPKFFTMGGYLKKLDYKTAFQAAYEEADTEDRAALEKLPNFDADIFFEISGIDLRGK